MEDMLSKAASFNVDIAVQMKNGFKEDQTFSESLSSCIYYMVIILKKLMNNEENELKFCLRNPFEFGIR